MITGHSLGGALALLYLACLLKKLAPDILSAKGMCEALPQRVSLITFGQPQVGGTHFIDMLEEMMQPLKDTGQLTRIRVLHAADPVPFIVADFVSMVHDFDPEDTAVIDRNGELHLPNSSVVERFAARRHRGRTHVKCMRWVPLHCSRTTGSELGCEISQISGIFDMLA